MGHEQEEGGKWPYAGTAEAIKALGAKHCVKGVTISFPSGQPAGMGWGPSGLWGTSGRQYRYLELHCGALGVPADV